MKNFQIWMFIKNIVILDMYNTIRIIKSSIFSLILFFFVFTNLLIFHNIRITIIVRMLLILIL